MTINTIENLRTEAHQAGLYVIQESLTKWVCIRKEDGCFLARERTEYLALGAGLARSEFM